MLTVDLVDARKKKGELVLQPLAGERLATAHALAASYVEVLRGNVGETREAIDQELDAIAVAAKDRRLADAVRKLALDACTFETSEGDAAEALRREVFLRAAKRRREGTFDRAALLDEIARERQTTGADIERDLYGDLRSAQRLLHVDVRDGRDLVARFPLAEAQAVLLRATRVLVRVGSSAPSRLRAFFRKLKFLQLLCAIRRDGDAYVLEIDGPYSLFDAVTKYGLRLAMLLPALDLVESWELAAEVLWGKNREKLLFPLRGGGREEARAERAPEEIEQLCAAIARIDGPWRAARANAILDLPGEGVCVPDLVLKNERTKAKVHVEVMGYWSRAAVWKRVEMVERGLRTPIVFAVSERLRVSEDVLPDEVPAALYVYKGVISPRALLERAERVARSAGTSAIAATSAATRKT